MAEDETVEVGTLTVEAEVEPVEGTDPLDAEPESEPIPEPVIIPDPSKPFDPHEGMEPGTPHTHDSDGLWQPV